MKILELKSIIYEVKLFGWAYQQIGDSRRNSEPRDRSTETNLKKYKKKILEKKNQSNIGATGVSGEKEYS